jgi:hypothetical protein
MFKIFNISKVHLKQSLKTGTYAPGCENATPAIYKASELHMQFCTWKAADTFPCCALVCPWHINAGSLQAWINIWPLAFINI